MENELWNLFRETGDPICYLLYKAEDGEKNRPGEQKTPEPPEANDASC